MAWIDSLFTRMVEVGASDLHMTSTLRPMFRLDGDMVPVEGCPAISAKQMKQVLMEITPDRQKKEFEFCFDTDYAYEIPGLARFRVNLFADSRGPGAVFRVILDEILTVEQLGLPAAVTDFCYLSKGLVLVTGPTGSGKSTTLAAMIDHINKSRADHIITIEDPIEFVHPDHKCLINQREVGGHTESFKRALRAALREDPDIVLVGELRDLETIEIAIETAETGHLVFGTLHTTTAASTVDRIIDQFPSDRQAQIRTMLSTSLKGVVAQTLCKKKRKGRVAALEVLVVNSAIASQIRDAKTHQIPSSMQMGAKLGMCTLNDSLEKLVVSGQVSAEEAYIKAVDKEGFMMKLRHNGLELNLRGTQKVEEAAGTSSAPGMPAPGMPRENSPEPAAPLPSSQQTEKDSPGAGPASGIEDPFERFKQRRGQ
ncbi:MAG: type IV pilus twitching motility protein PilT [bacterium]|nr:type IV pilus twitching motility protein PilT [bacterium]